MSSAAASRTHPGTGKRGETHHPTGQEPAPATIGPARVRVRAHHTGRRAESPRPPLQQLQRAVPEYIGMCVCGNECVFVCRLEGTETRCRILSNKKLPM